MKDYFYLACFRDNLGGNVAFHGIDGAGYTTNVNKARVLTRESAQNYWDTGRDFDQPISADHVNKLLMSRVDMQQVPGESVFIPGEEHKIYAQGKYLGNDLYWQGDGELVLDPNRAVTYTKDTPKKIGEYKMTHLPVSVIREATRSVFRYQDFNARTMVQGAGIKIPEHVRKSRRRARNSTGKCRWNCPTCGKISWQHNPYDFEGCSDVMCDAWRSPYL